MCIRDRHYYEQVGNYKKAYEYQKHDLQLNDSIRNERVRTRVAELDMRCLLYTSQHPTGNTRKDNDGQRKSARRYPSL